MKILVIRFSSLGDIVLTTPLYPNLKKKWPDAEITALVKKPFAPLFDLNPYVDHVRVFDREAQPLLQLAQEIRDEKFDLIIDLQGNLRSWLIRFNAGAPQAAVSEKVWLARMKLIYLKRSSKVLERSVRERNLDVLQELDVPLVNEETQLFPDPKLDIHKLFDIPPGTKLIGVAPGAKHLAKQWPAQSFAEAANRLAAQQNTMVLILGDKSDKVAAQEVANRLVVTHKNLTGWTSIRELTAVLSKLSFLLTNDSGIMHMAEALNVPLLAVFGPTVRSFGFGPYRKTSRVAEVVNLACRPCSLHGGDACPLGHHRCVKDVDVDAALFAASTLSGNYEDPSSC